MYIRHYRPFGGVESALLSVEASFHRVLGTKRVQGTKMRTEKYLGFPFSRLFRFFVLSFNPSFQGPGATPKKWSATRASARPWLWRWARAHWAAASSGPFVGGCASPGASGFVRSAQQRLVFLSWLGTQISKDVGPKTKIKPNSLCLFVRVGLPPFCVWLKRI